MDVWYINTYEWLLVSFTVLFSVRTVTLTEKKRLRDILNDSKALMTIIMLKPLYKSSKRSSTNRNLIILQCVIINFKAFNDFWLPLMIDSGYIDIINVCQRERC